MRLTAGKFVESRRSNPLPAGRVSTIIIIFVPIRTVVKTGRPGPGSDRGSQLEDPPLGSDSWESGLGAETRSRFMTCTTEYFGHTAVGSCHVAQYIWPFVGVMIESDGPVDFGTSTVFSETALFTLRSSSVRARSSRV